MPHNRSRWQNASLPQHTQRPRVSRIQKCVNLIGAGCVVHVTSFFEELEKLKEAGVETEGRIFIAKGAHVVTDLHQLVGACEEKALGEGKVGTTGKCQQATERSCLGLRLSHFF